MLLQLAEGLSRMPKTKLQTNPFSQVNYVRLPKKKLLVREDHFDRMSLREMACELSDNGYSLDEISELAGKRAQRKAVARAYAPAAKASAPAARGGGVRPGKARREEKKATKTAFKTAKKEQKISKKAAKTQIKQARAQKKLDTGQARKTKALAKVIKAQQAPPPPATDDIFDTLFPDQEQEQTPQIDYNMETETYDQETYTPEETDTDEIFETEEVTPEEMSEYLSARKLSKQRIKDVVKKGLKKAGEVYRASSKTAGGGVRVAVPVKTKSGLPGQVSITTGFDWNAPAFSIGQTQISNRAAAIGGGLLILTGVVITSPRRRRS